MVAEAAFAWLRHRLTIESLLEQRGAIRGHGSDDIAHALAALARHFGSGLAVPDGEADRYQSFCAALSGWAPHARHELPAWLWDRLGRDFGDRRTALADALLQPAPLDLRVNTLKARRDETLARLRQDGLDDAVPTPYATDGVRIPHRTGRRLDLSYHPLFKAGAFEVQDEGSQLLAAFVGAKRGEHVIDFCAGAGGKTLALAAMMRGSGRIYACDTHERRLGNLAPRLARSGADNVQTIVLTSERDPRLDRWLGKADRVLVDAPCSGLGTLRRNPELKWRQTPQSLRDLTGLQISILDAAARLVRSGGVLVYATCSLLREENDAIVEAFESAQGGAWMPREDCPPAVQEATRDGSRLRLTPDLHGCDGFFAAAWIRRPG